MNVNSTMGIDEKRLELLATKIFEYVDKANSVFNNIQNIVDDSASYFVSEEATAFRNKLKQQASYYYIVNQNLLSYASDLIKVKATFANKAVDISNIMTSNK